MRYWDSTLHDDLLPLLKRLVKFGYVALPTCPVFDPLTESRSPSQAQNFFLMLRGRRLRRHHSPIDMSVNW